MFSLIRKQLPEHQARPTNGHALNGHLPSASIPLPLTNPPRPGISHIARARFGTTAEKPKIDPFVLPTYALGVIPADIKTRKVGGGVRLAMDQSPWDQVGQAWNWGSSLHGTWAEGIGFMGYPYLAELSQRSEYRQPAEVMAEEMTRKWVTLKAVGNTNKDERIAAMNAAMRRLKLREIYREALIHDGFFGMGIIYPQLAIGDRMARDDPEELLSPLVIDKAKIAKGSLKGFRRIDPTWVAPTTYNSLDPMDPTFYLPQVWFIMGKRVHASRLQTFISHPLPDILKPAYNFGGLALSQMLKPYVDNWLNTRQGVADIIQAFTLWVLSTDQMAGLMGGGSGDDFEARIDIFTALRANRGVLAINKDTEAFQNISAPLGSLDKLQAQSQEQQAAVARLPLVKLLGYTPAGLNTTAEDEIRTFYDGVKSAQEYVIAPNLKMHLDMIQLSEFGDIDEDIVAEFNPLWQLDEAGEAAVRKTDADTAGVLIDHGVLDPQEERDRQAADPKSLYHGLSGDAPGIPDVDMSGGEEEDDPTSRIDKGGVSGEETGANSGV